ncbi:zinc finger protein 175-like [Pectinophora gossypiella]|uniref:Protein krueppel n=1 Tax=Pectinophora gossypiella TaxID=13191 RepID=A0A1E1WM96_PECGO|nr:zinc finger protein 175-like [Pectinophora gossypiella]
MTSLNNALCNVIYDKDEFCRLCLGIVTEETLRIQDEVVLTEEENAEELGNILSLILGSEITTNLSGMDRVCDECVKSALNCYTFMAKCRDNFYKLYNVIESVTISLEENIVDTYNFQSLFLTLDTSNSTNNLYYDDEICPKDPSKIIKRLKFLMKPKPQRTALKKEAYEPNSDFTDLDVSLAAGEVRTEDEMFLVLETINGNKIYYCKLCPKKCKRLYNLKLHFRHVHEKMSPHKSRFLPDHNGLVCSCCGKTFKDKKSLQVHEHNHTLLFTCRKCDKVYKSKNAFTNHMCRPDRERPPLEKNYICDNCGAKFVRKASLLLHIKYEHGDGIAHVCSYCDKRFYSQSGLKLHVVKHTKEKKYKCEMCGGNFVTKASLVYHVRTHTGEKPFKCKYCDMRFLSTSRRADHTRRHHMEPSLSCNICSKKFKGYPSLNRHRKRHLDPSSSLYVVEDELNM